MTDDVNAGRSEDLPYVINIADPMYQSMQGNYFLGQTRLLLFGNGMHAWGALCNPPDSKANFFIDTFAISNYAGYPFVAQVWFNTSMQSQCPVTVSAKVTAANTALRPVTRPMVKLQFAETVSEHPAGGVNPFNRIVDPRGTTESCIGGKFIIPPGGSFLIFLVSPGECLVRARIAFSWWEATLC